MSREGFWEGGTQEGALCHVDTVLSAETPYPPAQQAPDTRGPPAALHPGVATGPGGLVRGSCPPPPPAVDRALGREPGGPVPGPTGVRQWDLL